MNLTSLKNFAPEVRRQLMEAVGSKLDFVITGDTADLRAAADQVAHLRSQAETDRKGLIERVAYTWFNRLAALRFIDAHPGWHPFRANVVTAANAEETQPELLKLARSGALPPELAPFTDPKRLNDLLDGHLPSPDPQGEVYRHLILAACRFYHDLMPFLFEALDDETELLLPDDLLTEHSIAHGFRTEISDDDCSEVELVGWLYQFYISEKKDQVMARKSAVPSEDIPAVTQLFTPHWIVRYLVENSLRRLWLHSRPGSRLREHMPYYVDDPEGQTPCDCLTVARPEEIKLLDPASGSGHMLTFSFDLLYRIYEEEGHAPSEIPALILQHNLYGLDICPRAVQLAQFALICKTREKSRTAFRNPIQPQVMCLVDVVITPEEMQAYLELPGMREIFNKKVLRQIHQFRENTSTFGSLIQPVLAAGEIVELKARLASMACGDTPLLQLAQQKILRVIEQSEALTQRYHVVVANPPYMGSSQMNAHLVNFATQLYPGSKSDLFGMFITRCCSLAVDRGLFSMITMQSWMFIKSFELLRQKLLGETYIYSLAHLGPRAFDTIGGEVVQTVAFVIQKSLPTGKLSVFIRLTEGRSEAEKEKGLLTAIENPKCGLYFTVHTKSFKNVTGNPIAYWLSERVYAIFRSSQLLEECTQPRAGISTGCNEKFIFNWHEVTWKTIGFEQAKSNPSYTFYPHNKAGGFRKWYGNASYILRYDARSLTEMQTMPGFRHDNRNFYFQQAVSWGKVTGGAFSARYYPDGYTFDGAGLCIFPEKPYHFLGLLNSNVFRTILAALSQTMNFTVGDISRFPVLRNGPDFSAASRDLVTLARADWDNFENSWDFRDQPLLRSGLKGAALEASWRNWETQSNAAILRMKGLETENNRLLIAAYGLDGELQPEVPEDQITLARPDRRKDMAAFLSYAVGCMMGRYSLDAPGLILANAGDTLEQYLSKLGKPLDQLTFTPDEDGIIPVLDGEWFEDDIVTRTRDFLRATFGDVTLETNLHFIEESLGKDLRKYFLTDFYKDHLQTYKKRPIYWLFQSPKKGFSALVYLHRYTKDTPNRLLSSYLRDYLHKLRAHLEHLDHLMASESTPSREVTKARKESDQLKKTLRECEDYEREILLPLAQKRIELDLDAGVKVNYLKLGEALAPIAGLAAKEED